MSNAQERDTSAMLLVRLADVGDQESWTIFVRRYAPKIICWCRQNGLQESDASDVCQQVLHKPVATMRAFEYRPSEGRFRAWLKTVTNNAVHDLYREWRRHGRGTGDSQVLQRLQGLRDHRTCEELVELIQAEADRGLVEEAERRVRLRVKPKTWDAYYLTAVQQCRPAETADQLQIAVSDVYVAKSRVIKMLREELRKLEGRVGTE